MAKSSNASGIADLAAILRRMGAYADYDEMQGTVYLTATPNPGEHDPIMLFGEDEVAEAWRLDHYMDATDAGEEAPTMANTYFAPTGLELDELAVWVYRLAVAWGWAPFKDYGALTRAAWDATLAGQAIKDEDRRYARAMADRAAWEA